ncbi:murein biosynthesis integral membrane protein MurJ [Anaeromicrobium sediminis]|uniref:Probable lipid II flippase MurJ n=1 Tax=Anaeromicrobium sediminis TaxID=1478221 RepID=A0A267MH11_9FIRM|nr:murein biosynthesis integral membrane protein MurJ [Anaeromicrobium sediminis]PAB58757.1 murein biosynthesis integral membrane protein MurJ [Anaeromicrobium sediminis]
MSNYKKTAKTILMVIILSFSAKFMGFLRDALIGSQFGANKESDAYLIALNCTSIVFVSIGSALITGVIPIVIGEMKKGKEHAFKFVNNLLNILILISVILSSLGIIFSREIMTVVATGFDENKLNLSVELVKIMYPILICISITYVFVAMLQSLEMFKVTSLISFPANIISILYLMFLSKTYGVKGLAVITLVGWVFQFLVQVPFLLKEGYKYRFKINFKDENIKRVFKVLIPMIIVASSIQMNILIDEKYASLLKDGTVSYIHYGNTLYQAIATTTILGISMVVFPKFAQMSIKLKDKEYSEFVSKVLGVIIFILIPVTIGIIVLRNEVIGIVYERGAFGKEDTLIAGIVFASYSLGAVFLGIQDLVNKAFYAKNNVFSPMKVSLIVIVLNIILNVTTVENYGVVGLAISTSVSMIIGTFLLIYEFMKKLNYLNIKGIIVTFLKSLLAATIMFIVVTLVKDGLYLYVDKNSLLYKIVVVGIITTTGAITYGVASIKLNIKEAIYIYDDFLKGRFKKLT